VDFDVEFVLMSIEARLCLWRPKATKLAEIPIDDENVLCFREAEECEGAATALVADAKVAKNRPPPNETPIWNAITNQLSLMFQMAEEGT
jgi:hypothetical protein